MSLIAWLPLNTNKIIETINNSTIVAADNRTLPEYGANGKFSPGYTFSNSGIKVNNIPLTDKMSFSLWVKIDQENQGCHIIDFRASDSVGYQPIYYGYDQGVRGVQIHSAHGTNGYVHYELDANWHHLVITMMKNKGTLYVDGVYQGEVNIGSLASGHNVHLSIGCRHNGDNPFPGMIQDVRVYDHILSKKEIKELSKGLMLHYSFDNIIDGDNIFTGIVSTSNCTKVTDGVEIDWTTQKKDTHFGIGPYHYDKDNNPVPDNTEFVLTFQCNNLTVEGQLAFYVSNRDSFPIYLKNGYNIAHFNTYGQSENRFFIDDVQTTESLKGQKFTLTDFKLYKIKTVPDNSGYDNNGTLNNVVYTDSIINEFSASFNGTDSFVELKNFKPNLPNEDYTFSFWICPREDGVRDIIFGNYSSGHQSLNIERHTGNQLRIYYNADVPGYIGNVTMLKDQWAHIVIVRKNNVFSIWQNGVEELNATYNPLILNLTNQHWRIGSDYRALDSQKTPFNGKIADFRIYATALSEEDVKELYQTRLAMNREGQMFSLKLNEDSGSSYKATRSGQIKCSDINENSDTTTIQHSRNGNVYCADFYEI